MVTQRDQFFALVNRYVRLGALIDQDTDHDVAAMIRSEMQKTSDDLHIVVRSVQECPDESAELS